MVVDNKIKVTEVAANAKYIRMSPLKLRRVANVIKGKKVVDAIYILRSLPQKGADIILKVVKSAKANAINNNSMKEENLYISSIQINEGPRLKRYKARARGRIFQILKRTSHIRVGINNLIGENNGK